MNFGSLNESIASVGGPMKKNSAWKIKGNKKFRKRQSIPLTTLLEKYLQYLAVKGFADTTLRVRRIHMEMFLTWCRKRRTATRESRPAECHREPLAEPDMNLSAHPAPIN